jgi:hypothetical protein
MKVQAKHAKQQSKREFNPKNNKSNEHSEGKTGFKKHSTVKSTP